MPRIQVERPSTVGAPISRARAKKKDVEIPFGPAVVPANAEVIPIGRRRSGAIDIGFIGSKRLALGGSGRFLIDGRTTDGQKEIVALYEAAKISAAANGLFSHLPMTASLRRKVLDRLESAIESSSAGKSTLIRDKAFSGSASLLINLARSTPRSQSDVRDGAIDALLGGLDRSKNEEHIGFYVGTLHASGLKLTSEQTARLREIERRVLPERALVEEYTEGRTKPLEVRHAIHPEFWKEEVAYFSKKNGFTEVKRNRNDTMREYTARLEDPTGKKAPLDVHIVVKKGELDYLESLSDPDVHVILYSGHSAVGGNGSQAIQAAGPMRGKFPKLLFAANCRGKDNYAEIANKAVGAHIIATEHPTYSDSGQARVAAMFEMFARGETYRWMRSQTEEPNWDEPAANYFYPDQMKKFRFTDADEDGKIDLSALGPDALFDVERDHAVRAAGPKFVRALNFANSELFYHWELEHERGDPSRYGAKFADALIAAGPMKDARPGELVRVRPVVTKGDRGGKRTVFEVRYDPKACWRMDQNVMAGHVTAQAIMGLAKITEGRLSKKEALRAVLMGAQAIHYLDVYFESAPVSTKRYFEELGLTDRMSSKHVDELFERFDTHANDEQVAAFEKMLAEKYDVDLERWTPAFKGQAIA
jgi:hypothetical protein